MDDSIDSRTIEDATIPGLRFRVAIYPDPTARPWDADCYTTSQIAAWKRDEWQYVGVTVTPVLDEIELDSCVDSLWGLEYGHFLMTDEQDNETGRIWIDLDSMIYGRDEKYEAYPVPDMISECRGHLIKEIGPMIDTLKAADAALQAAAAND